MKAPAVCHAVGGAPCSAAGPSMELEQHLHKSRARIELIKVILHGIARRFVGVERSGLYAPAFKDAMTGWAGERAVAYLPRQFAPDSRPLDRGGGGGYAMRQGGAR